MRGSLLVVLALLAGCRAQDPAPLPMPSPEPATVQSPLAESPTAAPPPVAAPAPAALPARFQALGTEPFWSAVVDGTRLVYSTPENQDGTAIAVVRRDAVITGTLNGAPLTLTLSPGPCSDGMSDTTYPSTATLKIAGETLNGCARPK